MQSLPPIGEMERAYLGRDTSYDGIFFLGVRTTGVFCRPSCPARKPLPRNVDYFATTRDAMVAGYRPCKRCEPLNMAGAAPRWAQQLIYELERDPTARISDADLRARGLEPARVRRYFLKNYAMTFQAYCRGRRMGQALAQIRAGVNLDEVTLGNGYESHSGFREAFMKTFGLSPGRAESTECIHVAIVETPLGPLLLGSASAGLCLAEFTNRSRLETQFTALRRLFGCAIVPGDSPYIEQARDELERYFAGTLTEFATPLLYPGSAFQRAVWDLLCTIPYGETRSYESLAVQLNNPKASRAVGAANGMNRLAIFVPCHRVMSKSGQLIAYGGGLWRKQALHDLEQGKRGFVAQDTAIDPESIDSLYDLIGYSDAN